MASNNDVFGSFSPWKIVKNSKQVDLLYRYREKKDDFLCYSEVQFKNRTSDTLIINAGWKVFVNTGSIHTGIFSFSLKIPPGSNKMFTGFENVDVGCRGDQLKRVEIITLSKSYK
jgi:hypothetical protein